MNYTIEEIYYLVGKDDKTAGLTFKNGSEAYKMYGSSITVVFIYTQSEREEMDKLIQNSPYNGEGRIKAKYLGSKLIEGKVKHLLYEGINSTEIEEISIFDNPLNNTFHSKKKRELNKIKIPIQALPKGQDLSWMYGFSKKLANDGIGQCPRERTFFLAGKLYFEPELISIEENNEIFNGGVIDEQIEWEFLQMKYFREEISEEEKKRVVELWSEKKRSSISILDKYLKEAGSSLKKLATENIIQASNLFSKVFDFRERRLNVNGKHPIYINLDSYLHIYMRHVEEFKVNKHFENKDNFQWNEDDVFDVIGHVIKYIDNEYQKFREDKPSQRFSKFGKQSVYFEGDYYTFHIEANGRINTFYKNRKEHEQE